MKIKSILLLSTLMMALPLTSTFANSSLKPDKCPSTTSIIATGFDTIERKIDHYGDSDYISWAFFKAKDHYDTNEEWSFYFTILGDYQNQQDAIDHANALLSVIRLKLLLEDDNSLEDDSSLCIAVSEIEPGYIAIAMSPSVQKMQLTRLARAYLR